MSVISFIPARGGSKSIHMKNIMSFHGQPLVYWTMKALQESDITDEIIVATDSEEIARIADSFKFSKATVYNRDSVNARDESSTESVMLEYINKRHLAESDIFILAQATSPFTQAEHIDEAYRAFIEKRYDSLLTATRQKKFLWSLDADPINYDYRKRPRRQDFPGIYIENGAFYISTVGKIVQSGNRLSGRVGIFEMPEYSFIDIDEPDDWLLAEIYHKKYVGAAGKKNIKLLLTDVDGVLTDAGMYYSENGVESKKFSTYDGMAFGILREKGIKTGIITSENSEIVKNRAKKIGSDYLFQGKKGKGKLDAAKNICEKEGIGLENVAYLGDDVNCVELLSSVGFAACPRNAQDTVKKIPGITVLDKSGGEGVVREFVERYLT